MHSPLGPCHSSPSVPSYLRPTAAHMARASRNGPLESHAEESDMKKSINGSGKKKGGNVFSRIGSTLLAPTAAFVARVTGRNDPSKKGEYMYMCAVNVCMRQCAAMVWLKGTCCSRYTY